MERNLDVMIIRLLGLDVMLLSFSAAVEYKAINLRLFWIRFKLGISNSAPLGELEEYRESIRNVLGNVRENECNNMW